MDDALHTSGDTAMFCAKTHKNGGLRCSIRPGTVYNAIVWLPEKDDKKAIDLLIDHEVDQLQFLDDRKLNHLNKIDILRKERKSL